MTASGAFNLHLVSDSSGETVTNIARACLVQYDEVEVTEHFWWLVRTPGQMTRVIEGLKAAPGLVIFTLLDAKIRHPVMQALAAFFKRQGLAEIGRQHALDEGYFERIDAMHFGMQHDDGQSLATMAEADIILVGVSRTSKTPTCMYLANRGFKVGNIPLVPHMTMPDELFAAPKPLFVGLTREPRSLTDIRQSRLRIMNEERSVSYADVDSVREEVAESRRLFTKYGWPVIDVTRRSIEETAASIVQLYNQRHATAS